ncbi:MAG TPA: efflux RND transporter permease subunit [bacterium]|nr:efflux RND transporter permease subunit [bacterium]
MNPAGFSIRRPVTICMGILVLLALGGVSLTRLPIDLLPQLNLPMAVVVSSYSGAGPEEVEQMVTRPLEAVLSTVSNVKNVMSMSSPGSSQIMVEFNWGTDMDFAALDMREKIDILSGMLPPEVERPTVYKLDPALLPIMSIGVSSENRDLVSLKQLLEDRVINRLERIDGVAYAMLAGGPVREIKVLVDQSRLSGYDLTLHQLAQLLQSENLNLPGGSIKDGGREYVIRTTGEFRNLAEIRNVSLLTPTGVPVRLGDLAVVTETEDRSGAYSLLNGRPSLGIAVQKETGANTVQVAAKVRAEMEKASADLRDFNYSYTFDQSKFIKRAIGNLRNNAVVGGLLAIFILYTFLHNLRSTLIIALSIPISIIATFTLIYFNNLTLNMMSLGGFALGVGMLVDNSIVVLENIYRHRELGKNMVTAAQEGASEVGMAITASTLTTIAVFVPIVYIKGLVAEIFTQLALTVTFSLLSSLLVAMTLVPLLASRLLRIEVEQSERKHNPGHGGWGRGFASRIRQLLAKVDQFYRHALAWSLEHRRAVFGLATAAFVLSMIVLPFLGRELFPRTDAGMISATVNLPLGSALEQTGQVAELVENLFSKLPEVDTIFASVGGSELFSAGGMATYSEYATVDINLKPVRKRKRSDVELAEIIREQTEVIAGAEIAVSAQDMMGMSMLAGGKPISVQVLGDDIELLETVAADIAKVVKNVPGTREVETSFEEGRPEIQIRLKRDKAASLGVTAGQVAQTVAMAIDGQVVTRYRVGGDEVDIVVQLEESQRKSITDIMGIALASPLGFNVTLDDVADLVLEQGPSSIHRENQTRLATVSADIVGRPLGPVSNDIAQALKGFQLPEGYTVEFGGEEQMMTEAFTDLTMVLAFAVVLVYMVMAAQFESLLHPFTIMFSMPLALVGVVFGLAITGTPVSVLAAIGVIVLAGVVVNNAIVLVDYINVLRGKGLALKEAVLSAGPTRLRPILMTTLTTVLGLVPLALGIGEGGEVQAPLAITVIFGLTVSTILTLIVVPVVYTVFEDLGAILRRRMQRAPWWWARERGVNDGV